MSGYRRTEETPADELDNLRAEIEWNKITIRQRDKRIAEREEALKEIERWVDAWDEDFAPPLTDIEMREYEEVLNLAGLNITRYNGELIRRILADVGPIVKRALEETR